MALFLFSNTLIKADSMQDVINQNDSLVVDQPNQTKVEATASAPNVSAYSITNSGTFGTCNWDIDDTGKLTIHAGVLGTGLPNWNSYNSVITSVYVEQGVKANSNSTGLFKDLSNATTIDINNLDTSGVSDFTQFFSDDSKLKDINGLGKIDTSNAVSMQRMFYSAKSLGTLDVSNFDTKAVTDMSYMFYNCPALITGLSNFDTINVGLMNSMFMISNYANIKDIEGWNTAKVTNMSGMLSFISNLTSIDISNWDKSNVTNISTMFSGDTSLTKVIGLDGWNTGKVTNMSGLFNGTKFTEIPEIEGWDTSQVTNMGSLFYNCNSLAKLNLSNWDTSKVKNMSSMFGKDSKLNENTLQGLDNFKTGEVTDFGSMFNGTGFTVLNLTNFNTDNANKMNDMFAYTKSLVSVNGIFNTSSVSTIHGIFDNSSISDISNLHIDEWKTDKVTDFAYAFRETNFSALPEISGWKTDSGENFSHMFQGMPNLTTLNLSKWNTSNATDMSFMFSNDNKLSNVDISNFDTSNVKYINDMFYNTSNLDTIDTSNWNTSNTTTMKEMFTNSGVKVLDTSNWNTRKVTDITEMFYGAKNIGEFDLSNWDMSNIANMKSFFDNGRYNIWKLKLGPKSFFTADANFPKASVNDFIDQKENKKYSAISDKWQVVDEANGGTDHAPVGKLISNDDLASLYSAQGGPTATYVLQQTPFIDMKLDVPDLSFHKTGSAKGIAYRKEDFFRINITNNTSPARYVKSDVKVKLSDPIANSNGDKINGDLIFRDDGGVDDKVIGSDDTTILTRDFPMNDYPMSWGRGRGFLMKFDGTHVKAGDYSGTLTWTLQNSL
ncbi:hypothetical protein FC72_GL001772 [Companilactobacillus tucceti DSM 20183]|uniref:BspA family leucine-rich repeat surface protein n=2 Tax=Companilactobacillus tucceti TaxID=238012 RepID=A0A0R1JAA7_9LACO|nr:hypothetical protein FC72_GL001772 [Companilactobacillus tucceti DSM 20183]